MAEQKSRDRSSSTESQLKFPGCRHYRRRNDNHYRCQQCRLNEGLTLCTEDSPCEVCKDSLPEAWIAQEKAIEQKRKRKAATAAKAAKKSQEGDAMDNSVEIRALEDTLQLRPSKGKSDGPSKTKRAKTATGSGSKATEADSAGRLSRSRDQKKTVLQRVRGGTAQVQRCFRVQGVRTPLVTWWERSWRSHGSDRRHDSPRSHHSSRHDSGRRESGERARPMSSGGSSSRRQAHQRSGDAGHHQHCERLPASSEVPGCSLDVGQRSDCGLHQEQGRHTIIHTNADDLTAAQVVRSQGDYVGSRPSAMSAQHPGRFPVQSLPDTEYGVDDGHGASKTRVWQVGRAAGRLVCNIRQQTTHQVCIAVSGPQGRVDGRHVNALGQRVGPPVCVPAIQDGSSSSAEDRSVTRSQGDSDHSTATGSVMVSGVDGSVPRRSDPAFRRGSRAADSRRFDGRWGDGHSSLLAVKSTRMETLRAILRAKGHSREAARMMSSSLRDSSLQVYESHWARFVSFCRSFFQHLYDAPLQRQTSPIDDNITSHVCGFCATSLSVWSSSRPAHQATHQSFPAGTSGAT